MSKTKPFNGGSNSSVSAKLSPQRQRQYLAGKDSPGKASPQRQPLLDYSPRCQSPQRQDSSISPNSSPSPKSRRQCGYGKENKPWASPGSRKCQQRTGSSQEPSPQSPHSGNSDLRSALKYSPFSDTGCFSPQSETRLATEEPNLWCADESQSTRLSAALDGQWMNSQGVWIITDGSRMCAPDTGDCGKLGMYDEERCTLVLSGVEYGGWIRSDGSILWNDGDVWVRKKTDLSGVSRTKFELQDLGWEAFCDRWIEDALVKGSRNSRSIEQKLPSASGGTFDGPWKTCQGVVVIVNGMDTFTPDTGEIGKLNVLGKDKCSLKLSSGHIYEGWLTEHGDLCWKDGDVWVRPRRSRPVAESVSEQEKVATTEALRESDPIDQLQIMFPSWEREALSDVLMAYNSNKHDATAALWQWTEDTEPELKGDGRVVGVAWSDTYTLTPRGFLERSQYDHVFAARLERRCTRRPVLKFARMLLPHRDWSNLSREDKITENKELLRQRCAFLGFRQLEMDDDGNCQFRAVSQELFSTQSHHALVRANVVAHLHAHADDYRFFVEGDWDQYIADMEQLRTWGDEITLQAVADTFKVRIHLVTSSALNWYLVRQPSGDTPSWTREVFLTYLAPVHYNTIEPMR